MSFGVVETADLGDGWKVAVPVRYFDRTDPIMGYRSDMKIPYLTHNDKLLDGRALRVNPNVNPYEDSATLPARVTEFVKSHFPPASITTRVKVAERVARASRWNDSSFRSDHLMGSGSEFTGNENPNADLDLYLDYLNAPRTALQRGAVAESELNEIPERTPYGGGEWDDMMMEDDTTDDEDDL